MTPKNIIYIDEIFDMYLNPERRNGGRLERRNAGMPEY